MSITDELREYANRFKNSHDAWSGIGDDLTAIADRIDAEHESKVSYWQETSYKDGYDEGFASADDYFTDKRETLKEHGWVKLPLDADGVPIRIGDVVTMQLLFGGESKPLVVDRMELSHGRDGDLWCIALDTDKDCWNQPSLMHHYTPPTVEDVLLEACKAYHGLMVESMSDVAHDMQAPSEVIAEYAAKLRLAGDGE